MRPAVADPHPVVENVGRALEGADEFGVFPRYIEAVEPVEIDEGVAAIRQQMFPACMVLHLAEDFSGLDNNDPRPDLRKGNPAQDRILQALDIDLQEMDIP